MNSLVVKVHTKRRPLTSRESSDEYTRTIHQHCKPDNIYILSVSFRQLLARCARDDLPYGCFAYIYLLVLVVRCLLGPIQTPDGHSEYFSLVPTVSGCVVVGSASMIAHLYAATRCPLLRWAIYLETKAVRCLLCGLALALALALVPVAYRNLVLLLLRNLIPPHAYFRVSPNRERCGVRLTHSLLLMYDWLV